MSLQNPKTLRKYPENLQPQIFWPVIFKNGDALQIKLWNCVNFSFFYLKLFSVFIMNSSTIIFGESCEAGQKQTPEVFCGKGVLRNFAKFTAKHLFQSLFFNKAAGLRHRCFPVSFCEISRNTFSERTPPLAASGWTHVLTYILETDLYC